ncbi:hypothetical protein GE061_016841 [Apolygus lucorum]|uniref:BHLH domain-containing protein n=1 Tax=Apolygus lucorum TaxID=248454 RepID=A0A8S9XHF1_APOLU|nr:hypothetical protein GE061_016841 [Apolygus lucorum]
MDFHFSHLNFPIRGRCHANARERDRTQNVNTAFIILRTMIPTEPMERKLSKIETIRLATKYINHLAAALMTDSKLNPCSVLQKRLRFRDVFDNSLCTFCISDYKRYVRICECLKQVA